jgi:hypothetical protein
VRRTRTEEASKGFSAQLACISHRRSAASADRTVSASLRLVGLLNVSPWMRLRWPRPALSLSKGRRPCIHGPLCRFATKGGEECRLIMPFVVHPAPGDDVDCRSYGGGITASGDQSLITTHRRVRARLRGQVRGAFSRCLLRHRICAPNPVRCRTGMVVLQSLEGEP